eukprot:TRINITY_DN245_c0_g2_i3.p1 TRINITY_DN245_c0_g2~~TRINITY_DN245_c0_g2_i3.p1  ORF type:complete len:247 (-),score=37.03 TRINITY_DN245_c0_g2_i3:345-1085(-)
MHFLICLSSFLRGMKSVNIKTSNQYQECISTEACSSECLNSSLPEYVCLTCSGGECTEVNVSSESECGDCSIPGYSDQLSCESAGSCSISCPLCDQSQCEQTTRCSADDLYDLIPGGSTGICVTPFSYDFYGELSCEYAEYTTGCILNVSNPSECSDGVWYSPLSASECETTYFYCDDPIRSLTQYQCSLCDYEITSLYNLEQGTWKSGTWKTYYWTRREYAPVRQIGQTLDFLTLYDDLEKSIIP